MNITFSLYDYFGFLSVIYYLYLKLELWSVMAFESLLKSLNVLQNVNQFIFIIHIAVRF